MVSDAISTNLTAQSKDGAPPDKALAQWRADRPPWLPIGYQINKDSCNSPDLAVEPCRYGLENRHLWGLLGGQTVYRMTALFSPDQLGASLVTVKCTADSETRHEIQAAALGFEEGGLV
jgi:hypothetical protein